MCYMLCYRIYEAEGLIKIKKEKIFPSTMKEVPRFSRPHGLVALKALNHLDSHKYLGELPHVA